MNLQNGTLDTRLPQNIIRNFEIPANVEHDKLNPFKIGGGNAIWATHLPPNVNVWFSTNPNFDNAQKLDYMNRGMRFMSIGSDGLQQQYDNFYIFTEGTWNDTIKIAVSSQGDMVEPILSSNTGDIENVGRVAAISKMPVNGASGYNEPDFEMRFENKFCGGIATGSESKGLYFSLFDFETLNFIDNKFYLIEIDAQIQNSSPLWYMERASNTCVLYVFFGFPKNPLNLYKINKDFDNIDLYYSNEHKNASQLLKNGFTVLSFFGLTINYDILSKFGISQNNFKNTLIRSGKELKNTPVICFAPLTSSNNNFGGFYNIHCRFYNL